MSEGNGKDSMTGKFLPGNRYGGRSPGSPLAKRMGELRTALFQAVSADDLISIYRAMVEAAKGGDVSAAKLVLDHTIGKPVTSIAITADADVEPLFRILKVPPGRRKREAGPDADAAIEAARDRDRDNGRGGSDGVAPLEGPTGG